VYKGGEIEEKWRKKEVRIGEGRLEIG
jgi:hypothetical protein